MIVDDVDMEDSEEVVYRFEHICPFCDNDLLSNPVCEHVSVIGLEVTYDGKPKERGCMTGKTLREWMEI
jgi:hypothetical protein